jgi:hypothetical protein
MSRLSLGLYVAVCALLIIDDGVNSIIFRGTQCSSG